MIDYHLNIPGGGLWIVPCIDMSNGLNCCPNGVLRRSFAWSTTFLGIPLPTKN